MRVETDDHGEKIVMPVKTAEVRIDTQRGKAVEPEQARPLGDFRGEVHAAMQRADAQKMDMLRAAMHRQAAANESPLSRYRWLLIVAVIGASLATWRLLRR